MNANNSIIRIDHGIEQDVFGAVQEEDIHAFTMQPFASYVIDDTNGNLFAQYGKYLMDIGYDVRNISLPDDFGTRYNPLLYVYDEEDATTLAEAVMAFCTLGTDAQRLFATEILKSLIGFLCDYASGTDKTLYNLRYLISHENEASFDEDKLWLDYLFSESLERGDVEKTSWYTILYTRCRKVPISEFLDALDVARNALGKIPAAKLEEYKKSDIGYSLKFQSLSNERTAIFITSTSDNRTWALLVSLLFKQIGKCVRMNQQRSRALVAIAPNGGVVKFFRQDDNLSEAEALAVANAWLNRARNSKICRGESLCWEARTNRGELVGYMATETAIRDFVDRLYDVKVCWTDELTGFPVYFVHFDSFSFLLPFLPGYLVSRTLNEDPLSKNFDVCDKLFAPRDKPSLASWDRLFTLHGKVSQEFCEETRRIQKVLDMVSHEPETFVSAFRCKEIIAHKEEPYENIPRDKNLWHAGSIPVTDDMFSFLSGKEPSEHPHDACSLLTYMASRKKAQLARAFLLEGKLASATCIESVADRLSHALEEKEIPYVVAEAKNGRLCFLCRTKDADQANAVAKAAVCRMFIDISPVQSVEDAIRESAKTCANVSWMVAIHGLSGVDAHYLARSLTKGRQASCVGLDRMSDGTYVVVANFEASVAMDVLPACHNLLSSLCVSGGLANYYYSANESLSRNMLLQAETGFGDKIFVDGKDTPDTKWIAGASKQYICIEEDGFSYGWTRVTKEQNTNGPVEFMQDGFVYKEDSDYLSRLLTAVFSIPYPAVSNDQTRVVMHFLKMEDEGYCDPLNRCPDTFVLKRMDFDRLFCDNVHDQIMHDIQIMHCVELEDITCHFSQNHDDIIELFYRYKELAKRTVSDKSKAEWPKMVEAKVVDASCCKDYQYALDNPYKNFLHNINYVQFMSIDDDVLRYKDVYESLP